MFSPAKIHLSYNITPYLPRKNNYFLLFLKKTAKKFGHIEKTTYLCNRISHKDILLQ